LTLKEAKDTETERYGNVPAGRKVQAHGFTRQQHPRHGSRYDQNRPRPAAPRHARSDPSSTTTIISFGSEADTDSTMQLAQPTTTIISFGSEMLTSVDGPGGFGGELKIE